MNGVRQQNGACAPQVPVDRPSVRLQLPADHTHRDPDDGNMVGIQCGLSPVLVDSLGRLASRHATDLRTVVLAAWIAWWSRMSGQSEVLVGVSMQPSMRLLAVAAETDTAWTLAELLQYVGGRFEYAQSENEVSAGVPGQGIAEDPAFGAVFEWSHGDALSQASSSQVRVDVVMAGNVSGLEVEAELRFAAALFKPTTMQRHAESWSAFLQGIAQADDTTTIDSLPVLSVAERMRVVEAWNATQAEFPHEACLHELFEAQVRRTPQATALVQGSASLSYRELNEQANRLAHHLRELGVKPDDRIAICVDRGFPMIIGLLATLKAGGAYVPLDPAYPADRIAYMVEDSAPAAVLTQSRLSHLFSSFHMLPVLDIAAEALPWSEQPALDPDRDQIGLQPRHLAHVIYTSGSTGKPKGVAVEHRGICNLAVAEIEGFSIDASSRVLQFSSFSFDVSVFEIWRALTSGASLHLLPADQVLAGDSLARMIDEMAITHFMMPPAVLATLPTDNPLKTVHTMTIAGEALPQAVAARWQSGRRLINAYGPTEITVYASTHLCSDRDEGHPPIGRPLPNTRLYVLDERREPVPVGVAGELYLGGVGVARGYLNRPELTAERFMPDPFVVDANARMYKTGDLCRFRDDGVVEYLGRNDFQVKVRGFRIELGEIESRLAACPGVREAVVVAREDRDGDKRLVAYYVDEATTDPANAATVVSPAMLRRHVAEQLPDYMVPSAFVRLQALPLSPNGKLDRKALPAPGRERPELGTEYESPVGELEQVACTAFASLLDVEPVGRHDNFFELGGNSLLATRLLETLRRTFPSGAQAQPLPLTAIFQNPTPAMLAVAMVAGKSPSIEGTRLSQRHRLEGRENQHDNDPIAIIAMAGRFPGAADVETFWRNLCEGRDSITLFRPEDLDPGVPDAEKNAPGYVAARGIIDQVEQFDAAFFGINPREAELMDPQQRIFLELSWECMERAGHVPGATDGPVGVFAGMNNGTYLQRHVSAHPDLVEKLGAFQVMVANEKDYIATRVAHKLDLTGPAISTHTACSTSLVAICQAVDSLRAGQCDMALAGAASVTCPPNSGYHYLEGGMLSPDGRTRTFDINAQGTVFGDGAAVVLLKRLSDALADGDQVHALIRGGALNNDGGQKASFTAPSSDGQAAVIAMAHRNARVEARSISYVEAHGTGTPVGDPIEIEGLTKAFRVGTNDVGFCRVGSVKSNVGHLVAAAGVAGLIKTALSLREKVLPATVHFTSANPSIAFAGSPFFVNDALTPWTSEGAPRRAGVSSFGVGGTNAHVVMEEAPDLPVSDQAEGAQLLVLSARSPRALAQAASQLADCLEGEPDANLADVAWTLSAGRKAFSHRIAIAASNATEAATQLRGLEITAAIARGKPAHASDIVFLFPGQGSQYPGMGRELYRHEPAFREAFDACANAIEGRVSFDLRQTVFGDDAEAMLPTSVMQPAIFAIEYATAMLWLSKGASPAAMVGHSIGEFVAATLSGVFDVADAMRLVATRGALMQAQPAGSMLSVRLPRQELQQRLPAGLSLAAENSPGACVVSGPHDVVANFQSLLESESVACRMLKTSHAFHSSMMDAVVAPFREAVASVTRRQPVLPIVSTATGDWLDPLQAVSPDYWAEHLRLPVRFAEALGRVAESGPRVLLEVGPRTTLTGLSKQRTSGGKSQVSALASLSDTCGDEVAAFRLAAGQLWCKGALSNINVFDRRTTRRRIRLPTYPFERQRYWVEAAIPMSSNSNGVVQVQRISPASNTTPAIAPTPGTEAIMSSATSMSVFNAPAAAIASSPRRAQLVSQLKGVFEDVAGFDLSDADEEANFMELGLDSLNLTQVALQLQKTFSLKVTFRQLMSEYSSLGRLSELLDAQLPQEAVASPVPVQAGAVSGNALPTPFAGMALADLAASNIAAAQVPAVPGSGASQMIQQVIQQQMQVMSQQLAMLSGMQSLPVTGMPAATRAEVPVSAAASVSTPAPAVPVRAAAEVIDASTDDAAPQAKYDVQKAFGAIARIHTNRLELSRRQEEKLAAFIERYVARTPKSKAYTQAHRAHMADPRVVSGFRPRFKEIVYQLVAARSKGSRLWDIDGNEYVDANNGFGMSLFGWQPDFVLDAVRSQLDLGYEIGPQHPLAGEVCRMICEFTGQDRAALCNTGSEAVLGALRIARTVTGRSLVAVFSGSYHGINDEVVIRGNKKLQAMPGAPGILRNACENMLVLDYGTPESLQVIRERAHELAAVLVEPVQSRRPDFQPVEFLRELRQITRESETVLIFDEVITGFRAHAGGTQALFGIQADLGTYGKVVGGGYPLGVIAGKREYMDALDGGHWEYGDDSIPTVGVTYFAGTFVRHPLALAAAKSVLDHLKQAGPGLQAGLTERTAAFAEELNAFCREVGAPILVKQYASMWRTHFLEDHPLQDLLFAMIRSRGVHILDNFPCFFTTAHSEADIQAIAQAYKDAVVELQEAEFLPRSVVTPQTAMDPAKPPVAGARLGREPDGRPAWFVPDAERPGKYLKVAG